MLGSPVMRGEGSCQGTQNTSTIQPPTCWDKPGDGEKKKQKSVCLPHFCQCTLCVSVQYLKTTHATRFCYSQLPSSWQGELKNIFGEQWRELGLLCALSVRADRLLFLMNIQHLNDPSRGLWVNIAPLFRALIFYVTTRYPPMKWISNTRQGEKLHPSNKHCPSLSSTVSV